MGKKDDGDDDDGDDDDDIAINCDCAVIPVLATVGAHVGKNTERRFVTLWVISGRRWPRGGRGGGGNHGQVVVVTIGDNRLCLCVCVCCVFDEDEGCV
jgi:hypothetical protein